MMISIFRVFAQEAHKRGFHQKVVGDDAYTISRKPHSPMIKLMSARNGRLQLRTSRFNKDGTQVHKHFEVSLPTTEGGVAQA